MRLCLFVCVVGSTSFSSFFFPSPQGDPKGEEKSHKQKQRQKFFLYGTKEEGTREGREESFIVLFHCN